MHHTEHTAIRGIIFDLDGTLYRMAWFFHPHMFFSLMPCPFRLLHFLDERSKLAGKDFGSREQLLEKLCSALAQRIAVKPDHLHKWIERRFYPSFISTMRFQRYGRPQLVPTLTALRKRNIKLAVLSDYSAVNERLRMLQIPPECFDLNTSCESAGALKPSPRPFSDIAHQWELPVEKVLVVGDRDDTDGEAARKAGMPFLRITDTCNDEETATNARTWPALRQELLTL